MKSNWYFKSKNNVQYDYVLRTSKLFYVKIKKKNVLRQIDILRYNKIIIVVHPIILYRIKYFIFFSNYSIGLTVSITLYIFLKT